MLCMIKKPANKNMNQKQLNIIRSLQVTKLIQQYRCGKSILPHLLNKFRYRIKSEAGSATVEAALVIPVFVASICSLIMLGQFLLVESEVQYTLSQTAKVCARNEGAKRWEKEEGGASGGSISAQVDAAATFHSLMDSSSLNGSCIIGGKNGIAVVLNKQSGDLVKLEARYILKLPLAFLNPVRISRKLVIRQRIFGGYVPHDGEGDTNDPTVYVTDNMEVYHTSLTCTHLCLTIHDSDTIKSILKTSRYSACHKCIRKGLIPDRLYVTPYGDCYHASLSCSGLKRSVHAVKLSEVAGLRMCARCAAGTH